MWVDATDLKQWADRRDCQGSLPQLIRRLVRATVDQLSRVDFPSGEGVQKSGWDGIIEVLEGNEYVPAGWSRWELSARTNPGGKAEEDYAKRKEEPGLDSPSDAVFVFVTARRWEGKEAWASAKRAEGYWADVRAYDADDLEQWLELAPGVAAWLARLIGRFPAGVQTLEDFWEEYAAVTKPRLPSSLVLAGRESQVKELQAWLRGAAGALHVVGDAPNETVAFLAATVQQSPDQEREHFLARTLLADDVGVLRELATNRHPLVLVWLAQDTAPVAAAVNRGHHVYLPLGKGIVFAAEPSIELPRLGREPFVAALKEAGFAEEKAEQLVRESGRSLSVLRRRLATVAAVEQPEWAKPEKASELVPMLLARSFSDQRAADRTVLEKLARVEYATVAARLARWSRVPAPPVRSAGAVWSLTAPLDAWFLLAQYVGADQLRRFEEVAVEVLGADDPALELAPGERWLAAFRGKQFAHSGELREGIADALVLLACFGEETGFWGQERPRDVVTRVVWALVGDPARERRWPSLAGLLPLLAEAAPGAFLRSLEDALARNPQAVMQLFSEEKDPMGGGGRHHWLLWALEGLAWYPEHLGRASLVLAKLARLETTAARQGPMSSLRGIFLSWRPCTSASLDDRLAVIDMLCEREPEQAWRLLVALMPQHRDIGHVCHQPRWRPKPERQPVTNGEYASAISAIVDRAITAADHNGERLAALIGHVASWPPENRRRLVDQLLRFASGPEEGQRLRVWEEIRTVLSHHRSFRDADWALPEEELSPIDAALRALAPTDLLHQQGWLFDSHSPDAPEPATGSFEEREERTEILRCTAVREIVRERGAEGLWALARYVKFPGIVGWTAAVVEEAVSFERSILDETLGQPEDALRSLGMGYVAKRYSLKGDPWLEETLAAAQAAAWPPAKLVDFFLALGGAPAFWDRVAGLGQDVESGYWAQVYPIVRREDAEGSAERAVEKLLAMDRPLTALDVAGAHPDNITADVLLRVLERIPTALQRGDKPTMGMDLAYELERVLASLKQRPEIREEVVARQEWVFLPFLEHTPSHSLTLHRLLVRAPAFFAEVLSLVYRADGAAEDANTEPTEAERQRANQAYNLLSSCHQSPGVRDEEGLNQEDLDQWVTEARAQCATSGRATIGDQQIGTLLANSPAGADGVWPALPVRNLIERVASRHLETGIHTGRWNRRGPTTRLPSEGGRQERALAAQYRAHAQQLQARYPRTAALLREIADDYERLGHREDATAAQLDLSD